MQIAFIKSFRHPLLEISINIFNFEIQSTLNIKKCLDSIKYISSWLFFFICEVVIGLDMHDAIIRTFGGDFLIVILLYCFVKRFVNAPVTLTAIYVLLFSYAAEISQYFHLINVLRLQRSAVAKALLGTTFSFADLLCYTLGIALVLVLENIKLSSKYFKWNSGL